MIKKAHSRLHALDCLRGIAAFIVLFYHCLMIGFNTSEMPLWMRLSPLRILASGHGSVILFFVLSGYVLAIPYVEGKAPPYISYVIKRVCRIYLPFACAILLAALLFSLRRPIPEQGSDWFHHSWENLSLSPQIVALHLLMTGRTGDMRLDGVMWSLVEEIRISIIFPLLIILCRNLRVAITAGIILYVGATIVAVITGHAEHLMIMTNTLPSSFLLTIRFIPFFMIGIVLIKYNAAIQNWLDHLPHWKFVALPILAFIVFCIPMEIYDGQILARIFSAFSIDTAKVNVWWKVSVDFLLGLTSGLLIIFSRNVSHSESPFNIFNWHPVRWLGEVSYSLYLIHLPLVLFLFRLLLGKMNFWLITLLAIVISLVLAGLFNKLVERPSIRIGKTLAQSVGRRFAIKPAEL